MNRSRFPVALNCSLNVKKPDLLIGLVQALMGLAPFMYFSEMPVAVLQTMVFAIVALSTILMAVV